MTKLLSVILAITCMTFWLRAADGARELMAGRARGYASYDYAETAEGVLKEVRITIPEGLVVVRGILVVSNPAGADTRDSYKEAWYEEFMHLHGFAFMGTKEFSSHSPSVEVMQHALRQIAADSKHPELVNVPYAITGFSAGGGFASRLVVEMPERVIAAVIQSSRLNFTGLTPSAATLAVPVCIISGEKEQNAVSMVEPVLATYRPQGALYAWMTIQGGVHARSGQEVLAMPMLDEAIRLRYPQDGDVRKGPLQLRSLSADSGWLADNTTWKSGLTAITAAREFRGDLAKSSWLISENVAFVYRAYSTYDRPLVLASPHHPPALLGVFDAGTAVTISVDDSGFEGWKELELFDGARSLGVITGGPAQFTVPDLPVGFHAVSILGTSADGAIRPSNPALVIVRKPRR